LDNKSFTNARPSPLDAPVTNQTLFFIFSIF
jgi:hypothetical protein